MIEKAASLWHSASRPLIFFVVTFEMSSGNRWFQELKTYVFAGASYRLYRTQPALPWDFAPSEYLERADGECTENCVIPRTVAVRDFPENL